MAASDQCHNSEALAALLAPRVLVLCPWLHALLSPRASTHARLDWPQRPSVRTEYVRTAWQDYASNDLRFSLDEHMLMLREAGAATDYAAGGPVQRWQAVSGGDGVESRPLVSAAFMGVGGRRLTGCA